MVTFGACSERSQMYGSLHCTEKGLYDSVCKQVLGFKLKTTHSGNRLRSSDNTNPSGKGLNLSSV